MRRSLGIALILASVLAGCGGSGGGGGSASSALPNPGGKSTAAASATFTIVVPKASTVASGAKHPGFIPSSAQSIRIHIVSVNGQPPDPFFVDDVVALSTLNPACTLQPSGGLSCSIKAKVPVATSVVVQVSVYSSTDGSGSAIAVITVPPIDTTQPTIVVPPISLGGVPAHILTSVSNLSSPADGTTQKLSFNVWATDANNEIIVPPGNYPTPISLAINGDKNSALSLPVTAIASPGPTAGQTAVAVTYNSATTLTSATITLTSGTISNSVTVNPLNYSPKNLNSLFAGGSSTSISVSEAGYGGAFKLAGNGSNFSTSCIPASCTPSATGGVISIFVTPKANGAGTFTIQDSNLVTASVPFVVTGQTSGGINVSQYKAIEYALPSATSAPVGITAGPDGQSVWVAENGSGNVARINPASCIDSTTPPTCTINEESASGPSPYGIFSGDDGNVYITAPAQSSIEGFTLSSSCVSANPMTCVPAPLPMPTSGTMPSAIVRGNGVDYVTDVNPSASNILTLNFPATSVFDLYSPGGNPIVIGTAPPSPAPPPTPAPQPLYGGIAFGTQPGAPVSAGLGRRAPAVIVGNTLPNIWMTDNATGNIATPNSAESWNALTSSWGIGFSAALVEFGGFNGSGSGKFGGLTFAANGNLYVVEQAANSIAVVSTSTCYSYYALTTNPTLTSPQCTGVIHVPIPTASAGASAIIAGPDGNVWFAETAVNKIGILVPSTNAIHELALPANSKPMGLTVGPDGNVWFTGNGNGTIGKVVL